jgi:hypothetical protein
MTALERSYQRLLTVYPAGHRRTYGDEMIGVLLASAGPDQRRPGLADALDLFGGGARVRLRDLMIRLRALMTRTPDPGWRDALAVTTLLTPLLLVVMAHTGMAVWVYGDESLRLGSLLLVPVALGLLRLRRLAALAAAVSAVLMVVRAATDGGLDDPNTAAYLVLAGVQAFAFALSPGPRHALRLITREAALLAVPWLLTAAYMAGYIPTHYPLPQLVDRIGIAVIALVGLLGLATSAGRRLVMLLGAIPLSGLVGTILTFAGFNFYYQSTLTMSFVLYLPPVVLGALTALLIWRSAHSPGSPEPEPEPEPGVAA